MNLCCGQRRGRIAQAQHWKQTTSEGYILFWTDTQPCFQQKHIGECSQQHNWYKSNSRITPSVHIKLVKHIVLHPCSGILHNPESALTIARHRIANEKRQMQWSMYCMILCIWCHPSGWSRSSWKKSGERYLARELPLWEDRSSLVYVLVTCVALPCELWWTEL